MKYRTSLVGVCLFLLAAQTRAAPPKDSTAGTKAGEIKTIAGMPFVWCPAGKFTMGSPPDEKHRLIHEEQAEVTLSKGFWVGQHEVTQGEWRKVMGTPLPWKDEKGKNREDVKEGIDSPAAWVSWDRAADFCKELTKRAHASKALPPNWEFTLPTEAQWEYACRAGTTTRFSYGDDPKYAELKDYAWFEKNGLDAGERYGHQAGKKKGNPWNLYNIHGNLSEWCLDDYAEKLPGGTDPRVRGGKDAKRVIRGGSWGVEGRQCRSAFRSPMPSGIGGTGYIGFRLAIVRK